MVSTFGIRSISWWLFRFILFHQRILNARVSSRFDSLQVYMRETSHHFGTLENATSYWGAMLLDGEASFQNSHRVRTRQCSFPMDSRSGSRSHQGNLSSSTVRFSRLLAIFPRSCSGERGTFCCFFLADDAL